MGNKMDADFGNPEFDGRVFQIDATYNAFIENYDAVRNGGRFADYAATEKLSQKTQCAVSRFIIETLTAEYPSLFRCEPSENGIALHNTLIDEVIYFDTHSDYVSGGRFEYRDSLDALAAQIPEDLAIVVVDDSNQTDRLAAVHVVAPSGWNPQEKLGGSFVEVHAPVHHREQWFDKVQAGVRNIARNEQPIQRFGWGFANDSQLNHHPHIAGRIGPGRIHSDEQLYVRVERQVLKGFPKESALLFTIRVYVENCADLPPQDLEALINAVVSMSEEERAYKGIQGDFKSIVGSLEDTMKKSS